MLSTLTLKRLILFIAGVTLAGMFLLQKAKGPFYGEFLMFLEGVFSVICFLALLTTYENWREQLVRSASSRVLPSDRALSVARASLVLWVADWFASLTKKNDHK